MKSMRVRVIVMALPMALVLAACGRGTPAPAGGPGAGGPPPAMLPAEPIGHSADDSAPLRSIGARRSLRGTVATRSVARTIAGTLSR